MTASGSARAADTSNTRWELLPKAAPELRVPLGDPGDGGERQRGHARAIGVMIGVGAIVAGLAWIDTMLAVFAVIVATAIFLVQYRRSGGGARYRAVLSDWARERGLVDVGGAIWTWDGSTKVDEGLVANATTGARDAGWRLHLDNAAQLRGRIWDAAGPTATISAVRVYSPNETVVYMTVVTVPLGGPKLGELPSGIPGVDGLALTDSQLEVWVDGNLLRDLAMERWGRTNRKPFGMYAGAGDRMLALLGHARDIHRTLVGG